MRTKPQENYARTLSRAMKKNYAVTDSHFNSFTDKKAALSQRWTRDAPYIWVPWKFSRVPEYAHGYFSGNFYSGFCSERSYECPYKIWSY